MIAEKIIAHTPKGDMRLSALLYGILWNNPNSTDKKFEELSKRYSFTELGAGYLFADCFKDIARYVPERKKWFGYALTGSAKHECLFILFGRTTRNGKGLTMETTNRMLGGYARPCSAATIAQKQFCNSSGPSEDIASLAGARFINIPEPGKNMVLDAELVKTLTGNDKIVARFLHENSFAFYLTGKLFINTNYLPRISDATLFSSGRIKVIPFNREFEEDEQDKDLKEEFAKPENLSGILNWFIEGWNLLEQQGFDEPRAVKEATEAYRQDSDKIGLFMSELMVEDDAGLTPITDAYGEYQHWCYKNGYKEENVSSFKKGLGPHVEVKRKRPGGLGRLENPVYCICGYKLRVPVTIPVVEEKSVESHRERQEEPCDG